MSTYPWQVVQYLDAEQWQQLTPQMRQVRNLQNQVRVAYLQAEHEVRYGVPTIHQLALLKALKP